jgi:hypothetical protein
MHISDAQIELASEWLRQLKRELLFYVRQHHSLPDMLCDMNDEYYLRVDLPTLVCYTQDSDVYTVTYSDGSTCPLAYKICGDIQERLPFGVMH